MDGLRIVLQKDLIAGENPSFVKMLYFVKSSMLFSVMKWGMASREDLRSARPAAVCLLDPFVCVAVSVKRIRSVLRQKILEQGAWMAVSRSAAGTSLSCHKSVSGLQPQLVLSTMLGFATERALPGMRNSNLLPVKARVRSCCGLSCPW